MRFLMCNMKQIVHKIVSAGVGLICILSLGGCEVMQGLQLVRDQPKQTGLTHRQPPEVKDQRIAEQSLVDAREWQRKAASVGGEWRDVHVFIEQAEQAAARGAYQMAIDQARQARFQAEMGYRQMKAQEQVSNPPFLYF